MSRLKHSPSSPLGRRRLVSALWASYDAGLRPKVFPAGRIIGFVYCSVGIDRKNNGTKVSNLKRYDTTLISQRLNHLHLCYLLPVTFVGQAGRPVFPHKCAVSPEFVVACPFEDPGIPSGFRCKAA